MGRTRSGNNYGYRPPYRAAVSLGSSIRSAVRGRQRAGRSFTVQNRRRRVVSSGAGVTTQHDKKFIYRKKNMPRRQKMRWKRFSNKVQAVQEKDMGTRTILFNKGLTGADVMYNSTNGNQLIGSFGLYTARSTKSWFSDLYNISGYENLGNPTAAAGSTVDITSMIIFKSAVLDVTIRNGSGVNTAISAPPTVSESSAARMEVDIYELYSSRGLADAFNPTCTEDYFSSAATDTLNVGGAGSGITLLKRGATPWELTNALSRFGMTILKKTKYVLSGGECMTYQMRDPKRHVVSRNKIANLAGCSYYKWTRHVLVVGKLVPGLTVGTSIGEYSEVLHVGVTRKYSYKVEGVPEDRDLYIVG